MLLECRVCGAQNEPEDAFCAQCGEKRQLVCAECGASSKATARFCSRCGTPIAASGKPRVAEQFNELRSGGGERKFITVLFADIKNSTEYIASDDPETSLNRITPVLVAMADAVHKYDGVVSETLGDGVLALFGTPKPLEDHAVRACLAGLAIHEKIAELNNPSVQVRVGIHSGEAVIKAVDASLTHKLGAIGYVVHVANRVEQLCGPGEVFISDATFKQARQYIDAHALGRKEAKGLAQGIEVYRVAGLRSAPASSIFRTRDHLQPLAGRADEFAQLEAAFESASRGQACVVGVIGEAGIGKSRLCFEFVESCRRRDIAILEARAAPFGEATPLKPMLDLLQDYFRIRPIPDLEGRRKAVSTVLEALGAEEDLHSMILELLGLSAGKEAKRVDPVARKARLTEFICELVRQRPDSRPAVVFIEDLHWLDTASMELLESVVDAAFGSKTMLLLNFRPGLVCNWMQRSHYRAINLDALEPNAIEGLIVYSLGEHESLANLRADLIARSQGNPFFLEELTWALVEGGGLQGRPGDYRTTRSLDIGALPATIQGILSTRIDSLERTPKTLLLIAAVIAREIPAEILRQVAGVSKGELDQALRTLRRAELIYEMPRVQRNALLAFRHPLIQEVAYRNILSERKVELHAACAKALFGYFKDRMDEGAAILAYHFEKAGDMVNAAQAYARSATWLGANDSRQALATWKKVDGILKTQAPKPEIDFLRAMACGQVVNFAWREGLDADEVRAYFMEASRLALAGKNHRGNALIHAAYGRILAAAGSADEYVEKVKEAQSLAGSTNDASLRVTLGAVLAHALRLSGRLNEALEVNAEALGHSHEIAKFERETLGFDIKPWLLAMRGQTLVALGRGEEARLLLDNVIELQPNEVDVTHHMIPSFAYVEWAWATQNVPLAEHHARRAMLMADKSGSPYLTVYAMWSDGLAHVVAKRTGEAIERFSGALVLARQRRAGLENEPRLLADLANAYRSSGQLDEALETAEQAVALSRLRRHRISEYYACLVRGASLEELGDFPAAKKEAQIAGSLFEQTGAELFRKSLERPSGIRVAQAS